MNNFIETTMHYIYSEYYFNHFILCFIILIHPPQKYGKVLIPLVSASKK